MINQNITNSNDLTSNSQPNINLSSEPNMADLLMLYLGGIRESLEGNVAMKAVQCLMKERLNAVKSDILQSNEHNIIHLHKYSLQLTDSKSWRKRQWQKELEEATRLKQELERQLYFVNENVEKLKGRGSSEVGRRRNFVIENQEIFEKRADEAAAFIKRIQREKAQRKKVEMERLRISSEKIKQELKQKQSEVKQKQMEMIEKHKEDNKKSYLMLTRKRQKETTNKRPNVSYKKTSDYLYKKLENKYKVEVLQPDIEQKKQLLEEHKIKYKPFSWQNIKQHEENYAEKIRKQSLEKAKQMIERRVQEEKFRLMQKKMDNETSLRYQMLDIKKKQEPQLKAKRKVELRQKMLKYSDLIRDVGNMKPSLVLAELNGSKYDLKNQKVIESNKELCIKKSMPNTRWSNSSKCRRLILREDNSTANKTSDVDNLHRKKSSKNNLIFNKEWQGLDNYEEILAEVQRKKELMQVNNDSKDNIEESNNANDMLLETIKAKLAILEQI